MAKLLQKLDDLLLLNGKELELWEKAKLASIASGSKKLRCSIIDRPPSLGRPVAGL